MRRAGSHVTFVHAGYYRIDKPSVMVQAAEGQPQANKRTDTDDDEAMRPTKKVPFFAGI